MFERFNLKDRVILLTGGAGLYGSGLSYDLAAAGARLIIASRNRDACERVAAAIRDKGQTATAETLDQGDEESILSLRKRILEEHERIDGVVNNAVARTMTKGSGDVQGWRKSLDINATGIYMMHQYFGEAMAEAGRGSIVNIGSIYGMTGPSLHLYEGTDMGTGVPDYYFNKGGMINLTRFYAAHLGSRGVRVNCLSPGGFLNEQPEPFLSRYCENTFLKRMGNESDLGGAVVFLLSDAAAYITGVNLPVDGGFTAH
ncbi:MAG: SDR family oxidoreductase [Chthoniobacterales bacterium]